MTDVIEDEAPRLNKRDHAKIRTRAKVLAAARKLFAEKGHQGATIRGIAKEAGMSTGAVFANFKDKEDLYVAAHGHKPLSPEHGVRLLKIAQFLAAISTESTGVSGYHHNGAVAEWDEFEEVGLAHEIIAEINPQEIEPCPT